VTHVSPAPWEFERHRRGVIRWHPFDSVLNIGLNSTGSSATLLSPTLQLFSGGVIALNANKGREAVEKESVDQWVNADQVTRYFGLLHHLTVFMNLNGIAIGATVGKAYAGVFLVAMGVAAFPATPGVPVCALLASMDQGFTHRWELLTAPGDGVTGITSTVLTGVAGPFSNQNSNPIPSQRLELVYKPGEYVSAAVDGLVGATVTGASLPLTAYNYGVGQNLAGVGVYSGPDINDSTRAQFASFMIETNWV
jgi:hypothetical protein